MLMRVMRRDDIPATLNLCRLAGWNQIQSDWQRVLDLTPDGMFVTEEDGRVCGTAGNIVYGGELAWIGMVLVDPGMRRRGIATMLMQACIDYLRGRKVRSIKLDASDMGRPVYHKLGFLDEQPIDRYVGRNPAVSEQTPAREGVRPIAESDWPAIAAMDLAAFGADRMELLKSLRREGPSAAIEQSGRLNAFGFGRSGQNAAFLGPLVATDGRAAELLTHSLLAQMPPGDVYWDLLPNNATAKTMAESMGFAPVRRLTRMYLDANVTGHVGSIYGAAGLEFG